MCKKIAIATPTPQLMCMTTFKHFPLVFPPMTEGPICRFLKDLRLLIFFCCKCYGSQRSVQTVKVAGTRNPGHATAVGTLTSFLLFYASLQAADPIAESASLSHEVNLPRTRPVQVHQRLIGTDRSGNKPLTTRSTATTCPFGSVHP